MNINEWGNEELAAMMQDTTNLGRLEVLKGLRNGYVGLVKVALDDRFVSVLGDVVRVASADDKTEDQILYEARSSLVGRMHYGSPYGRFEALGLFDRHTGELYSANSYNSLAHFVGKVELENSTVDKALEPFNQAVSELVTASVNDPARREEFVAAARDADPDRDPYVSNTTLAELFADGLSVEDILSEDISVEFDVPHDITTLMSYLRHGDALTASQADAIVAEKSASIGRQILYRDALAQEYSGFSQNPSPNVDAAHGINTAFKDAFGEDMPKSVQLTVARDGKEMSFKYPVDKLLRSVRYAPESELYGNEILPVADREKFNQLFGSVSLHSRHYYGHGNIYMKDIMDVSYRGKSIYSADAETRAQRLASREVEVGFYEPDSSMRDVIFVHPGVRYTNRHLNSDLDVDAVDPACFSERGTIVATVGAHSGIEAMRSDILRQWHMRGPQPGDLMVVGDECYMMDNWTGCIEMPFKGDAVRERREQPPAVLEADEHGADLDAAGREMKDNLDGRNQNDPSLDVGGVGDGR